MLTVVKGIFNKAALLNYIISTLALCVYALEFTNAILQFATVFFPYR